MASPHANICGGKPRVIVAAGEEVDLQVIATFTRPGPPRHLLPIQDQLTGPPVKDWAIWVRK